MSADYRFSLDRPGRRLRPAFGLLPSYAAETLRPLPSVLAPWSEPSYTAQTEEYGRTRLPIFVAKLGRVETESHRIDAELRNRSAVGTIAGSGEQAVVVMPVTGACPANGPLAYVYDDLFAAAQANLATLGSEKPPRYSPADVIARWADLIDWNISIARRASNIDGMYQFPETYSRVAEVYRPAAWGSRRGGTTRTLQTQQGGFGSGETPIYRDGLPYPHNGEEEAVPQALVDASESLDRNLRSILRLETSCKRMGPAGICSETVLSNPIQSEACLYNPTPTCAPGYILDYPWSGWSRNLLDLGITQSRILPIRSTTSPFGLKNLELAFHATPEQILSGWVRVGSKTNITPGGAWAKLNTVFQKSPARGQTNPWTGSTHGTDAQGNLMTGWRYWNPVYALQNYQTAAMEWSRVSLTQMISESIAWYVFNHNVWYREKLGLTIEQLREQQRAVASAGLDRTSAPILGVAGAVGSAVNPAISIVIGILNAIGKELLLNFIQIRPDTPKPLFLRVPDPSVCEGRPEEQAGRSLCPPGTTGAYPNCVPVAPPPDEEEEGISPLAVGGALAAGLLLLWAVKKRKTP